MNTPVLNETGLVPAARAVELPTVTGGNLPGLAVLEQWVQAASHASRLVEPLIASAFVPEAYKPRIPPNADQDERNAAYRTALGNATSAVLLGMSLGVDPLTALQNIYIVHGRPGMYSKFKAALALAAGHDVWVEERSNESVTVAGRRKGWPADKVVRVTITKADAELAGWTTNTLYSKVPADMYQWRAMGRVVDLIAPDTLSGIASIEDLDDIPDARTAPPAVLEAVERPAAGEASQKLRAALEQPNGDAPDAAAAPADVPDPPAHEPWPISDQQWRTINARFVELGVTGAGRNLKRLAVISEIVGRLIERGSQLTAAEADLVLDNLGGEGGGRVVAAALGEDVPAAASGPVDIMVGDADPDTDQRTGTDDPDDQDTEQQRRAALKDVPDPWGINS
jgi:hypothetical protein